MHPPRLSANDGSLFRVNRSSISITEHDHGCGARANDCFGNAPFYETLQTIACMTSHDDDIALFGVDFLENTRRKVAGARNEDAFRRDARFARSLVRRFQKCLIVTAGLVVDGAKHQLGVERASEVDRIADRRGRKIVVDNGDEDAPIDLPQRRPPYYAKRRCRAAKHFFGEATEKHPHDAASAVRSYDDQTRVLRSGKPNNAVSGTVKEYL